MNLNAQMPDGAILGELGRRLAQTRLGQNLTQEQVAAEAGVSKRTIERLEAGEVAIQFSGFIRVLRALNMLDRIDALIPEPTPSPMAQLAAREKVRRRARKKAGEKKPGKWAWGDKPA